MSTLTVTAKGQVTLGNDLLQHLGVSPGAKITVEKLPDGRLELKAAPRTGKISDVFGFFDVTETGPHLTIEEIDQATHDGWAGKR